MEITVDNILTQMGLAGARLDHMGACEAGAGNISVSVQAELDVTPVFPISETDVALPLPAPALAGRYVFVTGSGCRLREVGVSPKVNVSVFKVNDDGMTGTWYYAPERGFTKPTSEFNSHLAVHNDQVARRGVDFHAVIHAQPPHLVSLSHVDALRNNADFNRAILRWEPETIVQVPAGVEVLDFMVPGGQELMENNVRGLRDHQITIWSKHGLMVRSDIGPLSAVDKVEYIETGAMYEIQNRMMGGVGAGLSDDEIRAVIRDFGVETDLF